MNLQKKKFHFYVHNLNPRDNLVSEYLNNTYPLNCEAHTYTQETFDGVARRSP